MNTPEPTAPVRITARGRLLPLYAAGFVTAFGAHSIAASLGGYTHAQHASLLTLGLLLAVYDGAEVALKPVFGSLADRVGARPVLLGGLLAFAAASAAFVLAGDPAWVGLARFGQGAAAAAFSPAAGVLVARLTPNTGQGRGSAVTAPGKAWATPWARSSVACSLRPAAILCCSPPWRCSVLSLLVGLCWWCLRRHRFLAPGRRWPILSADSPAPASCGQPWRWPPPPPPCRSAWGSCQWWAPREVWGRWLPGAIVSLLAAAAAVIQPRAGRARDRGRIGDRTGLAAGLALTAIGCAAVLIPGIAGLVLAALLIGCGVGVITPIGFAHLATTTPKERLGQTLGAAEVGRELGDAGGPLLVGGLAAAATLTPALLIFAALLTATAAIVAVPARQPDQRIGGGSGV